ncbi:hypothetical protein B0O99DRAFT_81259 [Bisporella sp. PMI_857]|nr:hypothetical protein B0O99DRAFT_81259 [Bisporella sp. PMI_857]
MFSTSVRRVGAIVPQTPIISSLANTAPRAGASQVFSYRSHQRRFSSSKPSNPADGSKGVAAGQAVPAAPTQATLEAENGKKAQKTGKTKAKNVSAKRTLKARDKNMQNIPSVPSTHHIKPTQIAVSDFFSLHRPISLSTSLPQEVTDEEFATIFKPRSKTKPADVISSLTNALGNIELLGAVQINELSEAKEQSSEHSNNIEQYNVSPDLAAEAARRAAEVRAQLGLESPPPQNSIVMDFPQHILTGKYQPFHPPPPPVPMDIPESLAAGAEAAEEILSDEIHEPHHRRFTTVLTIEESTDSNGDITFHAHSTPMQEESIIIAGWIEIRGLLLCLFHSPLAFGILFEFSCIRLIGAYGVFCNWRSGLRYSMCIALLLVLEAY